MKRNTITRPRPCPVCKGTTWVAPDSRTPQEWQECASCATWVLLPKKKTEAYPADYYGGPAAKFSGWAQKVRAGFHRGRARMVRRWIAGKKGRVYDVGCGDGLFLQEARQAGLQPLGFEPESLPRKQASQQLGKDLDESLFQSLGRDKVSAITCWQVIEHVADPRSLLARCHRQLATGGLLTLSTVNRGSFQSRCYGPRWLHLDPPRHLWIASLPRVAQMVEDSGFHILAIRHNPLEFGPVGWVDSFFNLIDSQRDRLLRCLKLGCRQPEDWLVWILSVGLTPLAILLSLIESWLGRPATFEIYARAERKRARRQGG